MAIKREVIFTVAADGRVSPSAPQDGGVQGEHNATMAVFRVEEGSAWTDPDYAVYIECEDNAGNVDATEELTVKDGKVSYLLPLAWTQYGGISTLRLVAEQLAVGGDVVRSDPATVSFSARQNASQKVDGLLKTRMVPMLQAVAAVEEAVHTAENAASGAVTAKEAVVKVASDVVVALEGAKTFATNAEDAAQRAEAAAGAGGGMTVIDDGEGNVYFTTNTEPVVCQHTYTVTVTTEPTCGKDGVRTFTCSKCGHTYTETIPATGNHVYDDDDDAVCNVCGHIRDVACDHEYSAVVTAPTCTTGGYTTHTCTKCGDTYVDDYTDALGHTYDDDSDAVCNVCGHEREVDEPDEPTEDDLSESSEPDEQGNHFLTLSAATLPYAEVGQDLTVTTDTGSKVLAYKNKNWCPTKSKTVSANTFIDLPMTLPVGHYAISAKISNYEENRALYGDKLALPITQLYNSISKGWSATGMRLAGTFYNDNGRFGVLFVPGTGASNVKTEFNQIQLQRMTYTDDGGATVALPTEFDEICVRYFHTIPYDGTLGINDTTRYDYMGEYDGTLYDVVDGVVDGISFDEGLTLLADDYGKFSVSHEYSGAAPAMYMMRRSAPAPASAPGYEEAGCPLEALVVNGRGYTSFPDKQARGDIAVLKEQLEQGGGTAPDTLPDYLIKEADRVTKEVISTELESDLSFLVFADPHSFEEYKYRKYARLMENGGIDFMLGLGDYQVYGEVSKAESISSMTKMLSASGRGANCLYVVGNHDAVVGYKSASTANTLTKKELHKLLCSHLNGVVHFDGDDPYGCHYYVDYEASKIRVIVLNSSNRWDESGNVITETLAGGIHISQHQMDWFTGTALDFTEKAGWSVMVALHNYVVATEKYLPHRILNALKNGTTYSFSDKWLTVNANFAGQSADVIGIFYGHGHHDSVEYQYGINSIQTRCDNADKDELYVAPLSVSEVNANTLYCFKTKNGRDCSFTISSAHLAKLGGTPKYFQYNRYLEDSTNAELWLLDEKYNQLDWFGYPAYADYTEGGIEIATDFTLRRIEGTASMESCAVVNINKDARTITVVPYGIGDARVVEY